MVAVSRREDLYDPDGSRRSGPPVRFGWGVLRHLLRHHHRYDVVDTGNFPYFSVLAARLAVLGRSRPILVVDWHEVWTSKYWRQYSGAVAGRVGWVVQALCLRATDVAVVFSRMNESRLHSHSRRMRVLRAGGLYQPTAGSTASTAAPGAPVVLFAGRHIPEKRVPLVAEAVVLARAAVPELRARLLGDGPQRPLVEATVRRLGAGGYIDVPGFVPADIVRSEMARASCLVLPSQREGYGIVVIEAAAAGTPVIVTRAPESAASELIEEGRNGYVTGDTAAELAAAIVTAVRRQEGLRASTAQWYAEHADEVSMQVTASAVLGLFRTLVAEPTL